MAYTGKLATGQTVYLDNRDDLTNVTISSCNVGQQQQSSTSFVTGKWTAPPEMYQTPHGVILKIITDRGQQYIEIQDNNHCLQSNRCANNDYHPIPLDRVTATPPPPIFEMQPMQPMTMGNMQMNLNSMEMRMGNAILQMNKSAKTTAEKHFCSNCGTKVKSNDRFCSGCGHSLN